MVCHTADVGVRESVDSDGDTITKLRHIKTGLIFYIPIIPDRNPLKDNPLLVGFDVSSESTATPIRAASPTFGAAAFFLFCAKERD